ncbi:MAG TPA: ribonuclease P protein component [Puia sp.]|nr:ribonuclease P protein component [Puia sp.]
MSKQFTFGKYERLKSRKLIKQLFSDGKSFSVYPFKIYYLLNENVFDSLKKYSSEKKKIILQCGVGVSSKNFKKAVDRNRIKRLMRESYRLQKIFLQDSLKGKDLQLALFLIYTGKELPEYKMVSDKIELILNRLVKSVV